LQRKASYGEMLMYGVDAVAALESGQSPMASEGPAEPERRVYGEQISH
jgi:hypothetical protein